jgi:dephospho-CoA kinase
MLIGILGRKRVGKDTTCDYLVKNYNFTKIALATPVKQAVSLLFNFTDDDVNENKDNINEEWGVTPRTLLKYFATDVFRKDINKVLPGIEDNFWVKTCLLKCSKIDGDVAISDVRFQNEIDKIHEKNGIIIKIINNNAPKDPDEDHIDDLRGDYTIYNESDVVNLYKTLDEIIKELL